jgi:uncharacterized membrane protein
MDFLHAPFAKRRPSMMSAVRTFRHRWIERMCERDNHIADAALLSNLLRGGVVFSPRPRCLSLVVLPRCSAPRPRLPRSSRNCRTPKRQVRVWRNSRPWRLIILYIYAFFKFTWSAWQYNVLSIMVGAMPGAAADESVRQAFALAGEPASSR